MFVGVLGFDRIDGRVSRSQDVVEDSEVHLLVVLLAGSFRLVGGAFLCLVPFGVDFRRCSPPTGRFDFLASLIWTRAPCQGERYHSRHALDD
jgi:hypothetical protein